MDFLRDLGVDAIITDHPDECLRRLGRDSAAS
jgi:glycerophosphoryl diester phosphodiesterase